MIQRSLVAILVSLVGITILVRINATIAHVYEMAGEKTRACFGLMEISFFYKYFAGVFGLLAITLAVVAHIKGEKRQWVIAAFGFSSLALLATFLKIWKLMV